MVMRNRPRSIRLALAVMLAGAMMSVIQATPAHAAVFDTRASAFGSYVSVGFFGGPANVAGPTPTVTLPPTGSATVISASAPSSFVKVGPAFLFSSNGLVANTVGSVGAGGSVSSSASVSNINTSGQETFTATSVASQCTASEGSRTGSATITGGLVQVSEGVPGVDGDETYVAVPNPTPANFTVHGVIEGVGDSFDYIFNEQILNPDGSITVNGAHQKLLGPSAYGDIWTAQSVCGVNPGGGRYNPLTPARILDTRNGTGGILGARGPDTSVDVQITGQGGVPASGVSAVAMNVTVTQPTAPSYLTISPAGAPRPFTANLNFGPGQTIPNLVVVKLGAGGKVRLFNAAGSAHVIFDVAGYYTDSGLNNDGRYTALVPARILDTRNGTGGSFTLGAGASLQLQVSGQGGVPASGVKAATFNVAITNATAPSYLTVYPTGVTQPLAANLNWSPGETISNRVKATLGTGGKVTIFNAAGSVDVIVDVGGWYSDATVVGTTGAFVPVVPSRILDTRDGTGGFAGVIATNTSIDVQITGRGGVPAAGVSAVILNATVTQPTGPGFLTISPTGSVRPLVSDLNYNTGETRPNLIVARVGAGGKINLYAATTTHVIFDVAGWFN